MRVSVLKGFARHGVRLALLFVCLSVMAGVSHAQAAGAAAQSTTKAAVPAAVPAIATPTAQPGQPAATVKRQSGGNHEGIMVHGHWTIDVRNPDGKLASHTEFENALQPQGADLLTGLLSGQYVAGGFLVDLNTSATPSAQPPISNPPLLCGDGACFLYDPRTYFASASCQTAAINAGSCGLLTYTANVGTTSGYAAGFTLGGTVINVPDGGTIQSVGTVEWGCLSASVLSPTGGFAFSSYSSQQCGTIVPTSSDNPEGNFLYLLTGATLPLPGSGLCGGAGQPECAVTVTAGQSVTVSVQITFGSGDTAAPGSASLPAAKPAK